MPRYSKRSRLFSESASTDQHHHEPLKGILKNSRIPTKRSVSECVDDLSQFMDDLEINIDDLKSRRFCPLHPFPEQNDEYSCDEDDDDDHDDEDSHDDEDDYDYENQDESDDDEIDEHDKHKKRNVIDSGVKTSNKLSENHDNNLKNLDQNYEFKNNGSIENNNNSINGNNENNGHDYERKQQISSDHKKKLKGCGCYDRYRSDSSDGSNYSDTTKPRKKSVRFDDQVYETVYIASRLYDRRAMAKYRFSSRHHPPPNGKQESKKQSKKHKTAKLSKSQTKPTTTPVVTSRRKSDDISKQTESQTNGCRLTKSQRSKQSKKDKLKMKMRRKEESCSSDDQGYGSSVPSFSD